MANGLGEYFGPHAHPGIQAAAAGAPSFESPPSPTSVLQRPEGMRAASGTGEYFAQSGIGAFGMNGMGAYNMGPVGPRQRGTFRKVASRVSPFAGALGEATDVISETKAGVLTGVAAATTLTTILLGMGLRFGAGWLVGKALAPGRADERTYSWGGAIASVLLGSVGLGATALVAQNASKK